MRHPQRQLVPMAMHDYTTLETEVWTLTVPVDWRQQETKNGELYIEAEDGEKGLYISTWDLGSDIKSQEAALLSFVTAEESAFKTMADSHWEIIERRLSNADISVAFLDYYDKKKLYRIVCKTMVRLSVAVNASFHDYNCTDYAQSKLFFDPIVQSLSLHG